MDKNEVTAQKLSELSRSETKEAHCAWAAHTLHGIRLRDGFIV
jgi:hypothetical protein